MPLKLSKDQEKKLGRLLVRGFSKKQLMVLDSVSKDRSRSITATSRKISAEKKIPLSTVKLDLKVLEQLELIRIIEKEGFKKVGVTKLGKMLLGLLSAYYNNTMNILSQLLKVMFSFSTDILQR
ncbi:MAG: hypothetical protein HYS62_03065 [Candidatus Aenigmarchaeota archaeon]|nr:hypothetical protein [Candidatus Aenigmarchaeota archaeon]